MSEKSVRVVAAQAWQGPLPPPVEVERFQKLLPDAAERLFKMAEEEHRHRIEMERLEVVSHVRRLSRGQFLALGLALSFLAGAVICAFFGATAIGVTIAGATIVGLVNSMLNPKRR